MWIEISDLYTHLTTFIVTPYAGVWIEIHINYRSHNDLMSLPTRECGLKFVWSVSKVDALRVTPYAGVWIEMYV